MHPSTRLRTDGRSPSGDPVGRIRSIQRPRWLALAAAAVLLGSSLGVLFHVTDVVGGRSWFLLVAAGAVGLGAVAARTLPVRVGVGFGLGLLVAGLGGYLLLIPDAYYGLFTVDRVTTDLAAMATGESVIKLLNADQWAIAVTPAPAFLVSYLALRRSYDAAAITGGLALGLFVLTGDASRATTVVGMTGALALLGFGAIDRWEGTWEQVQDLGLVLVVAVLVSRWLSIVPRSGRAGAGGDGARRPLEDNLLGEPGRVAVGGSISLSPDVRFSVSADAPALWRTGAFDRYSGDGWFRSGRTRPFDGPQPPPGEAELLRQTVRVADRLETMPAAWKPMVLDGDRVDRTALTDLGGLRPAAAFAAGEEYSVVSLRPRRAAPRLRAAGTSYPDAIEARYLQLPGSVPDRLRRRAEAITAGAETPYDAVVAIESWLAAEKRYSLSVRTVNWDVADAFVFELDRGYCVHFATALAVMLRTIGVPCRFVVGYSTGDAVSDGLWQVRGYHAHAWVEVFYPGVGWVAADPTPAGPRRTARRDWLTRDVERVGPGGGGAPEPTTPGSASPTPVEAELRPDAEDVNTGLNATINASNVSAGEPFFGGELAREEAERLERGPEAPSAGSAATPTPAVERRPIWQRERLSVVAGAAGLVIGAYRLGVLDRALEALGDGPGGPQPPERIAVRGVRPLERRLAERYRERRANETLRGYARSIEHRSGRRLDAGVWRAIDGYERVVYSGRGTLEEARAIVRASTAIASGERPLFEDGSRRGGRE